MNFENILIEKTERIATIIINRPTKLNALNKKTIYELGVAFDQLQNDEATKVIVITGSGTKAFVAGADIAEFSDFSVQQGAKLAAEGQETLFDFVQNLEKPVIAAINGFALGGGLELAMAAHFRVTSTNAKMGLPEVSLGVIPGYGGTQRLAQLIGKGKAMEMIMTANMLSAEEALKNGLVNYVAEQEDLLPLCYKLAKKITRNSSTAIAAAIRAVNANYDNDIDGYLVEINEFGQCFDTPDFKEGTSAFLEKRKPTFE